MKDIIISGLSKSYGDKKVLEEFCATLPGGKVSCIMGPSGRGKTTLAHILLGLVRPDGGSIEGLPGRCSAVFQEDRLAESQSVMSNLRMSGGPGRELLRLLEELGLGGWENRPVRELSGGMKRRVAIARALGAEYGLLALDEPFKGLDAEARAAAAAVIVKAAEGRTVLLITHDPVEAELLGAVNIIDMGRASL